ncbi:MAG: phosphoribosylamine--glycine ligase [Longimicrobiales bacterium]
MRILIVGHGGREHALLWKLRQDAPDANLFVTRGNGGTRALATAIPFDPADASALAEWADGNEIDLTVVGPEAALDAGIADEFAERRLPLFGPPREAAAIETSKAYAKSLMARAGVPTAAFGSFTDASAAEAFIRERGAPIVVKASGLAAGKGAVLCDDVDAAIDAARGMLVHRTFGDAGRTVVIEERLEGEEMSVFALTDGTHVLDMIPAQDYKRIGEGDTGPNTGGMGACAPVSLSSDALRDRIRRDIFEPTLAALRDDGRVYRGLLYAGLMITDDAPRVIEFNARFGDPETQALLPLLESSLLEPIREIANGGSIAGASLEWRDAGAVTTVLAAHGYPAAARKGDAIDIPEDVAHADDIVVFHAGTRTASDGQLITDGGRVLAVTAVGPAVPEAAERSRAAADAIAFDGKQFRRDIAWRELARHARTG